MKNNNTMLDRSETIKTNKSLHNHEVCIVFIQQKKMKAKTERIFSYFNEYISNCTWHYGLNTKLLDAEQ